MSKIIKLTSSNVKRLNAVEITPDGNLVIIAGENGQGKSSVLDSIQYALGGEPDDAMPVRRGETKAVILVDLGDLVVKRTLTAAGGSSLVVTNADGQRQMTPQAILDKLAGKLTFDPLDFSRQKPAKQAEILRELVGLNFAQQDAQRQKDFEERTTVNREVKALEARLASMPHHVNAPSAEVSAAEIIAEQQKAAAVNAENSKARNAVDAAKREVELTAKQIVSAEEAIEKLKKELAEAEADLTKLREVVKSERDKLRDAIATADSLQDVDLAPFSKRIASVEEENKKFRENQRRAEVASQLKAKSKEADALTDKIDKADSEKNRAITNAKYPVEGLLFDTAGGVSLNGIPFSQCSSAEQLKVSVAIGLALNPKLKVLLIRDGSLLDDSSLATIANMAKAADAQVWIERVGTDDETAVVIEDGYVKA